MEKEIVSIIILVLFLTSVTYAVRVSDITTHMLEVLLIQLIT